MTEHRPPRRPPPGPPPLDGYRPRTDLPPATQPPRPQQAYPPRPLPPGAQPRRMAAPGGRPARPDEGPGGLAYVGYALLAVVLLVAAGLGFLLINPPVDLIRREVVAQVKAKTGRDLTISGATRFTLYPSVGVSMEQVELSPPPGMGGRPMATVAGVDVSVALLPLASRRIEVDRLVLRDPVIELRTDASGRRSWDMRRSAAEATEWPKRRIELAQAAAPNRATDAVSVPAGRAGNPLAGIEQVSLRDVRIENGTLNWLDERNGARETLSSVNVRAAMRSIADPLEIGGDLVARGGKLDVTASLGSLAALLSAQPSKVTLKVRHAHADIGFDGTLDGGLAADGKLDMTSGNVRALAALAGVDLGAAAGIGQASVSGRLTAVGAKAALDAAQIVLDGTKATGRIAVDAGGGRPRVSADLDVGELNLTPYLAPRDGGAGATPPPSTRTPPAAAERGPSSIDDLLSRPAPGNATPQVRGFTQRAGWSEEPIRLAALAALDADVKLRLAKVVHHEFKAGQTRLNATLASGVLKVVFEDVALYDGRGRGAVTVDATTPVPRFGVSLAAEGVSLQPLLRDAGAKSWLSGTAKITAAVTGEGGTQKAMMDGLAGKADLTVNNGAVIGWNLAQIIRGLKQGQLSGLDRVETAKTDFSDLSASWTIAEGVAQNQDFKLNSPLMRVTGAGRVGIGARQIDFQLKPKLVASLEGQGAAQGLGGLEIPLRVKGPWDRTEIVPEVGDLLKDPDKALGAVKEIGKQFKGKSANEIVDKVLGDNPGAAKKANDFLNKLLKPK